MSCKLFLLAATLLSASVARAGDVANIVNTAEYFWRFWDRYQVVPTGCYRQSFDKPFFFVCNSRLSASKDETQDAFRRLERQFDQVRVNSRRRDWDVFDHNAVHDNADFWTLEHGPGCDRPGLDDRSRYCFVIAVDNERRR